MVRRNNYDYMDDLNQVKYFVRRNILN